MFSLLISIHALRKESDKYATVVDGWRSISIHALRKESDYMLTLLAVRLSIISIHALRKESDQ